LGQWKKAFQAQRKINTKHPTPTNNPTFFGQETLTAGEVKSYWHTAGSIAVKLNILNRASMA
jgi:hypothetical protein